MSLNYGLLERTGWLKRGMINDRDINEFYQVYILVLKTFL